MLSEQLQKSPAVAPVNRKCETCGEPLAIETRSEDGDIMEVIYFCINKLKNCPMYHEAQ